MKSAYSAIKGFDWVLISCVVCIIQIFRICTLRAGNPSFSIKPLYFIMKQNFRNFYFGNPLTTLLRSASLIARCLFFKSAQIPYFPELKAKRSRLVITRIILMMKVPPSPFPLGSDLSDEDAIFQKNIS